MRYKKEMIINLDAIFLQVGVSYEIEIERNANCDADGNRGTTGYQLQDCEIEWMDLVS